MNPKMLKWLLPVLAAVAFSSCSGNPEAPLKTRQTAAADVRAVTLP